ncbi:MULTISPECIES: ABC transporter ATP-binding protein [unclassified Achromobacter]|uniref:ABC transporter ATP-binding protein n=1 Tax=unclassified Achromobacter TaxID=2626865 RepID=UPI000B51E3D4|nr:MULTISPECIES: ABC transporter ATP-binding protein [unclassified Achromobacter]OWT80984.1 sugar ABC transporter ATP-binding protein [Achromobacter sp. HZ34]OWT81500.1 sugar ABC transporter ATP-binding protein [Achromobacter sp. HZ28]
MSQVGRVNMQGVVKRHGAFTALHGIDLDIQPGEFFALLGPSGSGKTTTLRILAGLEAVDDGRVWLDQADMTHAAPGERDVAMVFQSYALYPHMTVAENIGFPLKMVRTPTAEITRAVREAAEKVDIAHLLARRPGQLSGGQQQRCALARAIVRKPKLFLLDEPLSNLDAKLRIETRAELRRLQRSLGVTAVYVTHDQEEAMTVADRMAVFMEGRVVQVGTPREVYARPADVRVAAFIGTPAMNLLPAQLRDGQVEIAGTRLPLPPAATAAAAGAGEIVVGVRPGDLRIVAGGGVGGDPDGNAVAAATATAAAADAGTGAGIAAIVEFVEDLGDSAIVNLKMGEQRLKARHDNRIPLAEGQAVRLSFEPAAMHLFERASGRRI